MATGAPCTPIQASASPESADIRTRPSLSEADRAWAAEQARIGLATLDRRQLARAVALLNAQRSRHAPIGAAVAELRERAVPAGDPLR